MFLPPELFSDVAVVLLIDSVEFRKQGVVTGQGASGRVFKSVQQSAAKIIAGFFEGFVFHQFLGLVGNNGWSDYWIFRFHSM